MLVSVIMPTYNCGKYIAQSLDSVISQTVTDWEVQIVDDCSTDDTYNVVLPYLEKYPNIHYYVLPENGGPAVARTEAIKRANGKYIAFLDSDDLWDSEKLENQIAFMEKNGADFSATGYRWMDENGNDLHTALIPPKKTDYKKMIRLSNPIGNLSVMYNQEKLGKFEVPPIKKRNDFALWLKILKKTDCCYGMQEILGTYRMGRSGSVSSNKLKQAKYHWQLYHDIEGHNVFRSFYEIVCWAFVKGTGIGINRKKTNDIDEIIKHKNKKVGIIGHFGFGKNYLDGQTVKTKIVSDELKRFFGENSIDEIDTHGKWSSLIKAPFKTFNAVKFSKNVIMLPAHKGLKIYAPLLCFWRHFFNTKLHYVVIGGWLPKYLQNKKLLQKNLKKFDGIYVETRTMKTALEQKGFKNIYIMPNCKRLNVLRPEELVYNTGEPFKLCTFSRVTEKKGIGDAVEAVRQINEENGRTVYTLDIYGQVDNGQEEWFEHLKKTFPEYVHYCGLVPFDKSVDVLKNYFALLFPTKFYTEGIPGTIIDAYAAGIPVISSRWENFEDIIDEGITGVGYDFANNVGLFLKLRKGEEKNFDKMKANCLKKAELFLPERAMKVLREKIS